jgi:hypothetical protein
MIRAGRPFRKAVLLKGRCNRKTSALGPTHPAGRQVNCRAILIGKHRSDSIRKNYFRNGSMIAR